MEIIKKLFKEHYEKSSILFELTIGLYLLKCNYRNIFQLWYSLDNNKTPLKTITDIIMETKFDYIKKKNESTIIFIIYNQKTFNIKELDKTDGKKYAKQLTIIKRKHLHEISEYLPYEEIKEIIEYIESLVDKVTQEFKKAL